MNEKTEQLHIYLSPKLKSRLEKAAKQDDRSMNNFVVLAIEAACAKAEEQAHSKPLQERPLQ